MKVTFIFPNIFEGMDKSSFYHMGIGYLSAFLKKNGHQTSLINIYKNFERDLLIARLKEENPDIIGFSSVTPQIHNVITMAQWIKEDGIKSFVICGGIHATLDPQFVINIEGVDAACCGEGEYPLLELCEALQSGRDYSEIRNLWVKKDGDIKRKQTRPLIEDLDSLPFPDRELFDRNDFSEERQAQLQLIASRGCPYNCSYCSNHAIKSIYPNKNRYVRFRSVDNIIKEELELKTRYPEIKHYAFEDDILYLNKEWYQEFSEKHRKYVGLPFHSNIHPALINEDSLYYLKYAGCTKIQIGLESGNENVRKNILNRKMSNYKFVEAISLAKKMGFEIFTFNLIGIPDEKPSDILDTIKLNAMIEQDSTQVSILYPFPKTDLYNYAKNRNYISEKKVVDSIIDDTKLEFPSLNRTQILVYRRFFVLFVKLYRKIYKLGFASKYLEKFVDMLLISKSTIYSLHLIFLITRLIYRKINNKLLINFVRKSLYTFSR
jgi:radical SAM superfamily enzyme YgiQ (UPF0313 family)